MTKSLCHVLTRLNGKISGGKFYLTSRKFARTQSRNITTSRESNERDLVAIEGNHGIGYNKV